MQEVFLVQIDFSNCMIYFLGGGLKYWLFSSLFGEMTQFDQDVQIVRLLNSCEAFANQYSWGKNFSGKTYSFRASLDEKVSDLKEWTLPVLQKNNLA